MPKSIQEVRAENMRELRDKINQHIEYEVDSFVIDQIEEFCSQAESKLLEAVVNKIDKDSPDTPLKEKGETQDNYLIRMAYANGKIDALDDLLSFLKQ